MVISILFITLLYTTPCKTAKHWAEYRVTNWDYGANGPSTWPKDAPQCKGANQSPIDITIEEGNVTPATSRNYVNQTNYGEKPGFKKYNMTNNGHSLEIKLPANTHYRLVKGEEQYIPMQINVHFDPISGRGSEHTINGKKFFAEIHVFHRNLRYDQEEIHVNPDGLVNALLGIAILVEKRSDAKRTIYGYEEEYRNIMGKGEGSSLVMDLIAKGSQKIKKPGKVTRIDAFPLAWILPTVERKHALFDYINYFGSLTTPPCLEIVDWVVVTGKTLVTSDGTAKRLKDIIDNSGKQMSGNNRQTQEINGRKIYGVQGRIPRH